jgi:GNAT superfamily N-acetyltransferase
MTIRPAQPDDIDRINALFRERITILAQADARFRPLLHTSGGWREGIEEGIHDGRVFVAQDTSGDVIGYIACIAVDGIGVIPQIALDAHTYHGGVGRDLFRAAQQWFDEQAITTVAVGVPRFHPVEQAFWRGLGATEWQDPKWQTTPEYQWLIF